MDKVNTNSELVARVSVLEEQIKSLEKALYNNMQVTIGQLKYRIEELEKSFLDEVITSTKYKFDNFRNYLANKIMP